MAQSGYTPISFYYSSTSGHQPTAGNLVNGELAINIADGVIYYKNAGGTVAPLGFGGTGLTWQAVQVADFTAVAGNAYPINTSGGVVTVTLPASPVAGDIINFTDDSGNFATNNLTIDPNGNNLLGASNSVVMQTNRESLSFVYIDSTQGWLPYDGFNSSIPPLAGVPITYLVVAGGGGGGSSNGGGGGAGGLLTGTSLLTIGTSYPIVVGAGGSGSTSASAAGSNGANSSFNSLTAIGGGGGGSGTAAAGSGGSGGGGGNQSASGTGTSPQGNNGGAGHDTANSDDPGGGGGGAGAAGSAAPTGSGGAGGNGVQSSITGTATYYAGGGGGSGSVVAGVGGAGGLGGGGTGATTSGAGTAGTNGLGAGGGGGGFTGAGGGNGGSGVVILSIPTSQYTGTYTGTPTVTTVGGNTVLQFTSNGSYTA